MSIDSFGRPKVVECKHVTFSNAIDIRRERRISRRVNLRTQLFVIMSGKETCICIICNFIEALLNYNYFQLNYSLLYY